MNIDDIRDLYRYNDWANQRLVAGIRALSAEAGTGELGGSFKSVRDLVWHVVVAEWFWLARWQGGSPDALPSWGEGAELPALLDRWAVLESERNAFLATLTDAMLETELSFRYLSGTPDVLRLDRALQHVANHATYHRGQLASMIRQLGGVPPATDLTEYWRR